MLTVFISSYIQDQKSSWNGDGGVAEEDDEETQGPD